MSAALAGLRAALDIETRKTTASTVSRSIVGALVGGVALLSGAFCAAVASGNVDAIAKLGPAVTRPGWAGLLSGSTQIAAAATVLALGTLLSWMLGREFTDGTITGLFALPVGRGSIAMAKLAVFLVVAATVALGLALVVLVLGLALGFGLPSPDDVSGLVRLAALVVLSALVAAPAGWAATLGRGVLPGIGASVALLASAQVAVIAGGGVWFPMAAPALWAIHPDAVSAAGLIGTLLTGSGFVVLTVTAWARLQLDR